MDPEHPCGILNFPDSPKKIEPGFKVENLKRPFTEFKFVEQSMGTLTVLFGVSNDLENLKENFRHYQKKLLENIIKSNQNIRRNLF